VDVGGESLGDEVVDPLEEVGESEALGEGLAGHVGVGLGASGGRERGGDGGSQSGRGNGVGDLGHFRGGGDSRAGDLGAGSVLSAGSDFSAAGRGLGDRNRGGDRDGGVAERSRRSGNTGRRSRAGSRAASGRARGARRSAIPEGRARDLVRVTKSAVDADLDASILRSVESRAENALRVGSTAASDLEVEALGVVLGTVDIASAVEGDDLVTEDVLAGSERLRNGDRPLAVSSDELVGSPLARSGAAIDQASLVNLEELKRLLVNGGAVVTSALGEVVDDGTVVRLGPGVSAPLDLNLAAGGDRGGDLASLGLAVADDVARGVAGTVNETVVTVVGTPSNDSGRVRHVDVVVEESVESLAISGDAGNATVGVCRGSKGAQKSGSLKEGHCV